MDPAPGRFDGIGLVLDFMPGRALREMRLYAAAPTAPSAIHLKKPRRPSPCSLFRLSCNGPLLVEIKLIVGSSDSVYNAHTSQIKQRAAVLGYCNR